MATDDKIRDEKLQYDINREAIKISALSSRKVGKYEYLIGEQIMLSNQGQIIEQANFPCPSLGKFFKKQTEEQVDDIKSLKPSNKKDKIKHIDGIFPRNLLNGLISDKLKEIVDLQDIIKTVNLSYKSKSRKV